MILRHSAYIFGQYVQPQNVTQQVYFDNGQFNNLFVPAGFDYSSDIIELKVQSNQRAYEGYPGDWIEAYYPEKLNDGVPIVLQNYDYKPITEKFILTNNLLVLDHTITYPGYARNATISVLLPMLNYFNSITSTYSKINITGKIIKDANISASSSFSVYLYTRKDDGTRELRRIGYNYGLVFISQEWSTLTIDISGISAPADIDFIALECKFYSQEYDTDKHIIYQIKKIWTDCID